MIRKYTIVKKIEETNAAIIYKVKDISGTYRVLKTARQNTKEYNNLIIREFQILKTIKHPNIVEVQDLDSNQDGRAFFLQPYLSGKPINACFNSFSPDLVECLLQIINALVTLHNKGFIHGDLKPKHLLYDVQTKNTLLIDFGYARVPEDISIRTGTFGYIAPEVLKGIGLDQRSDLYSLGVIIYEILSGKFLETSWQDIPSIPGSVNTMLCRLCSPDPSTRPLISEIYDVLSPFGKNKRTKPQYAVGLPPTTFVGRKSLMDTLLRAQNEAYTINGEAGVGKTRLLLELKYCFIQQGYTTLYYFSGEQNSLMESLCTFLRISEKKIIRGEDKYAVFRNVCDYLKKHASRTPLILLIDEVESITDYDRSLLRYIGFGLNETNISVICTTTSSQIAQNIGFNTLTLDPFSEKETKQLVTSTFYTLNPNHDEHSVKLLTEWLQKQSGGNPLYLVELLTTIFNQSILIYTGQGWTIDLASLDHAQIPERLENLIMQRLEHTAAPEQTILQALALVETPIDSGILNMAFGSHGYTSIEHLKHHGFVKEDIVKNMPMVFIPNQIIRDIIRSRISTPTRKKHQKQLVIALEKIIDTAPHYIPLLATLCDQIGNQDKAISYARQTAKQAENLYNHESAVKFYRIILNNTPEHDKTHFEIALKIAELYTTMGQCTEALKLYQNFRKRAPKSFHRQIIADIARTYYHMGQYNDAVSNLKQALKMCKNKQTEIALEIQTRLAYCLSVTGKFTEAGPLIDKCLVIANKLRNKKLISTAMYYKAVFEHQRGNLDISVRNAEKHIRFTKDNDLPRDRAFSTLLLSRIYQDKNDLKQALGYVDQTIDSLDKTGDTMALLNALDCKAGIQFSQGELNQVRELYEHTLLRAKQTYSIPVILSCLSTLGNIGLLQGNFEQTIRFSQDGLKYDQDRNVLISNFAEALFKKGNIEKARKIIRSMSHKKDNLSYQQTQLLIAVEEGNQSQIAKTLRTIDRITANIYLTRNIISNLFLDIIYALYRIEDYSKSLEYINKLLALSPKTDVRATIARILEKLAMFHIHKHDSLDISQEIAQLDRTQCMYHIVRLQRMKIEALLNTPQTDESTRLLNKELLDALDIATKINAGLEIQALKELQNNLFPTITQNHVTRSTSPEYLEIFSKLAELIDRNIGHDNFLSKLLDITIQTTNAERGALFLNTFKGMEFILGRDMDKSTILDATEFSKTAIKEITKNKIIFTQNALDNPDFSIKKSIQLHKIRSLLCIPLAVADNVIGALYLDSRYQGTMFGESDKHFLLTVSRILAAVIDKSMAFQKLVQENVQLRKSVISDIGSGYLIGESRTMKKVYDLVDQVSITNAPVLLVGETGTGKGMVARLIHQKSNRKDKNFTLINCGTIPETLLESELFGHKRGAFTGAVADKTGLLAQAHGGTIFLDEITNTTPAFQAKLLEAIEDKVIRRVGETTTHTIDVRFLFATNKDLEIEVEEARFRKDLYYRINVFKIEIPPLRERGNDISLLAQFFLDKSSKEIGKKILGFTSEAKDMLRRYFWAGNVRELRHVVDRAVVLAKGTHITRNELNIGPNTKSAMGTIKELKKEAIIEALEATNHNVSQAARILGVNRRTIQRHMKKFNL